MAGYFLNKSSKVEIFGLSGSVEFLNRDSRSDFWFVDEFFSLAADLGRK